MDRFAYGQAVKIQNTFTDDDDNLINPTTIQILINRQKLDGTFELLETFSKADCTQISTGVWELDYLPENEGLHSISVITGGNLETGVQSKFIVNNSTFVT